jgi:hypothetical protein
MCGGTETREGIKIAELGELSHATIVTCFGFLEKRKNALTNDDFRASSG